MNDNNNGNDKSKRKKFNDDPVDDDTNFGFPFGNLDEFMKKIFGAQFDQNSPIKSGIKPSNMHFFNISYKFNGKNDKPEIKINGEPVDEEAIKNMMDAMFPEGFDFSSIQNMIEHNSAHHDNLPVVDASQLKLSDSTDSKEVIPIPRTNIFGNQDPPLAELEDNDDLDVSDLPTTLTDTKKPFETPFMELMEDPNAKSAEITVELPGIEKEKVSVTFSGKDVTIVGGNEYRLFRAEQKMSFVPDPKKIEIDGKNGIYQIKLSA